MRDVVRTMLLCAMVAVCAPVYGQAIRVICAGSTFAAPLYQTWGTSYGKQHPDFVLTYRAIGSQAGVDALQSGEADLAASDFPPKATRSNSAYQLVPTVVGAAVPVYNLPHLRRNVRFTPQILADIYLGKITHWNDTQLQAINRNVKLPPDPIAIFYRGDGSGTSHIWSAFLSEASGEWNSQVGAGVAPRWPRGTAVTGSQGLVDAVARTPDSLGYVELIYALRAHLGAGEVKNAAGEFVAANIDSVTAAASTAERDHNGGISLVNAPASNAYPIASITWLVVPLKISEEKRKPLQQFIDWALSAGQAEAGSLGFVALPPGVIERERNRAAHLFTP